MEENRFTEEGRFEEDLNQTAEYGPKRQRVIFDMGGLKLAFWGLLFTVINIRIQGFDIVPDVIGYIIAIIGLGRIERYDDNFSAAKKMAYILAVLSLINIVQVPTQTWTTEAPSGVLQTTSSPVSFSAGIFGSVPLLAILFMIAGTLANLYFTYSICMGLKRLLLRVGDNTLAGICDDRWKLILIAQVGLLLSMLIAMTGFPLGAVASIAFVILALIALVLFLLLIHHSRESIDGKEEIS